MSRSERAKEYFLQGYACSQAVALAFSDVMPMDEATISKITLPFGGGLGRLRLTCGAVSGMACVLGSLLASATPNVENKKETYGAVQEVCECFQRENGSLICGELLKAMKVSVEVGGVAEARTSEYYKKRSCADMVANAADILEKYLLDKGFLKNT